MSCPPTTLPEWPSGLADITSDYFFIEMDPNIRLANSSENPKRAFAREYRSTAFLSNQMVVFSPRPSPGRAR